MDVGRDVGLLWALEEDGHSRGGPSGCGEEASPCNGVGGSSGTGGK
jgi:hypothetical protein